MRTAFPRLFYPACVPILLRIVLLNGISELLLKAMNDH